MSSRNPAIAAPDVLSVLLPIVRAALPADVGAGRKYDGQSKFVQLRTDLQGMVTPISRYCRVGITAWWIDSAGRARVDEAFDLSNIVVNAILSSRDRHILDAEWQSGPAETVDTTGKVEVAYSTVLLEVTSAF